MHSKVLNTRNESKPNDALQDCTWYLQSLLGIQSVGPEQIQSEATSLLP